MAYSPTATFGQLFPFQTSCDRGQSFLIAGNRGRMANSTAKRDPKSQRKRRACALNLEEP